MRGLWALIEPTCQNWFAKFRAENFDINDAPRPGRPQEIEPIDVKTIANLSPSQLVRDITEVLGVSHTSVQNHLRKLGNVSRLDVWVPQSLTEANMATHISICDSLQEHQDPFLKRLVTGDEKLIVYDMGLHPKKIMLSVWWGFQGSDFL
ncbi:histone-lysine N-methyltransferase SETMAR-like [Halyomorpha halys]|uniref:histone-lysine N-methyltransferase SETMAR-like n=1 Tax=Halyomorpha halys TaxID=286706 RepID=UPI0034D382E6